MLRQVQKTLRQPHKTVLSVRPSPRFPRLGFKNHHTITMNSSDEPTVDEAKVLFERLEQKFPSKTLGIDRWYLVVVRLPFASSKPRTYC